VNSPSQTAAGDAGETEVTVAQKNRAAAKHGNQRISISVGVIHGHDFGRVRFRVDIIKPNQKRDYESFLSTRRALEDADFFHLLAGSKKKQRTLDEAMRSFNSGGPTSITTVQGSLIDSMTETLRSRPYTASAKALLPKSIRSHADSIQALAKFAKGRPVKLIADVLWDYRNHCESNQHNFPFNRARATCLWFAQKQSKQAKTSALYLAVRAVPPMHTNRKRERNATITPRRVRKIQRMMREQGNGHLAHHVMNLALLAVRPDEYTNLNSIMTINKDRKAALILGTKNPNARRFIPIYKAVKFEPNMLVEKVGRRTTGRGAPDPNRTCYSTYRFSTFEKAFREAIRALGWNYQLYDLRGSGRNWMALAGISQSDIDRFLGHSQKEVRKGYGTLGDKPDWNDWKLFVIPARSRMVRWLKSQRRKKPEALEAPDASPAATHEAGTVTLTPDQLNPSILRST
jgi:hypothetical protein